MKPAGILLDTILTSFWAAKIEFMIGIYDAEMSGETERISILASKFTRAGSAPAVPETYNSLFMPFQHTLPVMYRGSP